MRQNIDKFVTILLRFLLPFTALVLPLFFLPATTDFFNVNKSLFVLIVGSLSLLAWLVRNITRRHIHISLTPTTTPLLLLSLVYVTSSLFQSPNYYMGLIGRTSTILAFTCLFLGVTSSQKNKLVVEYTLGALFISGIVASLFSLASYFGLITSLGTLPSWLSSKTFNPTGGPIPLLSFITPLLLVSLYLTFKSSRWSAKTLFFLITLLFSGTIFFQAKLILSQNNNQIFLLPIAAGWSIAVDIFKNWRSALLGTGPETFISAFTQLKPGFLNQTSLWNTRFNSSSNELFSVLTTTGLLGTIFWLAIFLKPLRLTLSQIGKKKTSFDLSTTTSSILVLGVLIANLVVPASLTLLGLTFISLTILNISLKLHTEDIRDVSLSLSATTNTNSNDFQLLPWLAVVIFIPSLSFFWYFHGRSYAANLATFKASTSISTNATQSYNQQIKAYTLEPRNPYYRLNFSQTSLALANSIANQKELTDQDKANVSQLIQQAIREAKTATQLDPSNAIAWENLGLIYRQLLNFAQGASDWTIASYNQAILLDPNNARLRLDLGGVFFILKDNDSAQKLYEQAIVIKPDWANAHYNLAMILKTKKDYTRALSEMRTVLTLVEPNSKDAQLAQDELKELEKLIPPTPVSAKPDVTKTNLELVTPTPPPANKTKVNLPADSAPVIPTPTPTN